MKTIRLKILFMTALALNSASARTADPEVLIKTDLGDIKVEVYEKQAPITAANFLQYVDQPELDFGGKRNPDGQGFAAFGRVIEGMDIVKKIQLQPAGGQMLVQRVNIHNITRLSGLKTKPPWSNS